MALFLSLIDAASRAAGLCVSGRQLTAAGSVYGAAMEPGKPLVLVDVDGVLNPARSQAPGYRRQWVFPGGLARRLLLNPSHGPMLTELAEMADAELVWATYWRNRANTWIAPRVGLPTLRYVPIPRCWRPPAGSSLGTWKACQVAGWVGKTPFVWFEDDAGAVSYIAGQQGLGRHLVVKVDPAIGLTYRTPSAPGLGSTTFAARYEPR